MKLATDARATSTGQGLALTLCLSVVFMLSSPAVAGAAGAVLPASATPLEQRVAVATSPTQTTYWVQLRANMATGSAVVFFPAPAGTRLDWASPAWMEALENATAPRILPPSGVSPACPGEAATDGNPHVLGDLFHVSPDPPQELLVHTTVADFKNWLTPLGLSLTTERENHLIALGQPIVAARFDGPTGLLTTATLRLSLPVATGALPYALVQSQGQPMAITTWIFSDGGSELTGTRVTLDQNELAYLPASLDSNYDDVRSDLLLTGTDSFLIESASHQSLDQNLLAGTDHIIAGLTNTYFSRALVYAGGGFDPLACEVASSMVIANGAPVGNACAPGAAGDVNGAAACDETLGGGEQDPELLRCDATVDDLALALTGLSPSDTWLTRATIVVDDAQARIDRSVVSANAMPAVTPVVEATTLSLEGCPTNGSGGAGGSAVASTSGNSSAASASGGSTGSSHFVQIPVYDRGSSCDGADALTFLYFVDQVVADDEPVPDAYYEEEDCGGDPSDSYTPVYNGDPGTDPNYDSGGDACSGDTSGPGADSGDGCSGDTTSASSDGTSGDPGTAEGCSGDSGSSSGDPGGASDDSCSGDSSSGDDSNGDCEGDTGDSGDACDGGTDSGGGSECSAGRVRRRRRPRMSMLLWLAAAIAFPMRRLRRRQRTRVKRSNKRRNA